MKNLPMSTMQNFGDLRMGNTNWLLANSISILRDLEVPCFSEKPAYLFSFFRMKHLNPGGDLIQSASRTSDLLNNDSFARLLIIHISLNNGFFYHYLIMSLEFCNA